MGNMDKAIGLALKEFESECGKLVIADGFVRALNDDLLMIGFIEGDFDIEFILGELYKINFDLNKIEVVN